MTTINLKEENLMNIIIIEPSETSRIKIESLLHNMHINSDELHTFENGQIALDFIREEGADLIFTALHLEELDGVSFTDLLLNESPALVSKLFILSSEKNLNYYEEIKEVGAKRFIKKPINEKLFNHFIEPEIHKLQQIVI